MDKKIIGAVLAVTILILGVVVYISTPKGPSVDYSGFAQCLKDSGATFYGAFWCPHCQAQKAAFGASAAKLLPYVECSTPDGNSQTQVCIDKKIEQYPTWIFKDGSIKKGEVSLAELASTTACVLPQ